MIFIGLSVFIMATALVYALWSDGKETSQKSERNSSQDNDGNGLEPFEDKEQ